MNYRQLTATHYAGILSAFTREGNNFSICCNTGAFLLDILTVITVTVCLAPLTVKPPKTWRAKQRWWSFAQSLIGVAGNGPPCTPSLLAQIACLYNM